MGGLATLFTTTGTEVDIPPTRTRRFALPAFAGRKKPSLPRVIRGASGLNWALSVTSAQKPSAVRPEIIKRRASLALSKVSDAGRTRSSNNLIAFLGGAAKQGASTEVKSAAIVP